MIPEHEIFVHYIDHLGNKEAVTANEDGSYSVFIDPALSTEEQQKAYQHALEHINDLHFEKTDVQQIELDTHHIVGNVPVVVEQKVPMPSKRKRRKKNYSKEWREINERRAYIERHYSDPTDYYMRKGEYNKLYRGI